ncbi:MAG: hypothetical protein COY11_00480, partial [Candidatus Portnoybacteria bacterium CG_4_10_14_0_2_um_filter_44_20]
KRLLYRLNYAGKFGRASVSVPLTIREFVETKGNPAIYDYQKLKISARHFRERMKTYARRR